ncbi:hypothetical protein COJ85_32510 [Bacillus sp. AFS076308]|uniref:hypothetical protein n=1 Tax=Bacillus sp. AFS076308 TaxID=2033512 RepID=UPI000BF3EE9F|nr:hypothetical protein [Bacillus sp. AFS076308]PFN76548.1 hypothetical protein COJ85_32510 [Bacillus sp. AFS076308]PGV54744.1 hypothetical protein COD92_03205 [Bacillus sp. AFS037270]
MKKARFYGFKGVFIKFDSIDVNNLKITGEGVDDQELAHFGGLDLHVKATKMMIINTNGFDLGKTADDYLVTNALSRLI